MINIEKMISRRCEKFVAVLSDDYFKSEEFDFNLKVVLSLSPSKFSITVSIAITKDNNLQARFF